MAQMALYRPISVMSGSFISLQNSFFSTSELRTNFLICYNAIIIATYCAIIFPSEIQLRYRPNSPGPLTDDWKVTDDSSVNFHDVFFFIFCYNLAKNEEKHITEIYG